MSVEAVFSATAAGYDKGRRALVPCFERLYGAALELLPTDALQTVDLGAGTGLFSAMLRERMPLAHLHLVDISEPMLAQARQRLEGDENVSYLLQDYSACSLPDGADAVASALSIHHLEHDAKRTLFARVREALRPGGVFVNADHIAGPTEELERAYVERWLDAVRRAGATAEQVEKSLYRQLQDRRASVPDQLEWLRAAGFIDVDCWFKDGAFAVFVAVRPAAPSPPRS